LRQNTYLRREERRRCTVKIVKLGTASARKSIAEMQRKLSVHAGAVTKESRRKTIELFGEDLSPIESVRRIVGDVRRDGDKAVFRYAKLLDGFDLNEKNFRVSPDEIAAADREVSKEFLRAARKAVERVRRFQEHILEKDPPELSDGGKRLGMRLLPVRRVGVHVPGFSAVLPSSVIMTCVPAQVAGVKEITVCSPPNASGRVSAETLACCGMLGVEEVYRMGGAQAIAALALGTASVRKVDMVAGPGNIFTTLAKKEVFGEVAIDLLAGPSEVLVLADDWHGRTWWRQTCWRRPSTHRRRPSW
jgi:histidinol dehydrogenase